MSANECELLLSKIIDIIIRYENQIEDIRIQLAKNQYFFPSPSFKRIAIDGKGYLKEEDLEGFLRHYGLSVNDRELRRFFISDKEKSAVMSYNSFLDQVLPCTDLELKTKCLERKTKDLETVSQVLLADVDRLITSIYQKEIELFRALKGNINRFIEFDIELIEFIFSQLSDDSSGYLTFKSLLNFMKKNGYTFDKRGYESLMKRVDKKAKGRINHVELKFFLLSNEAFQEPNQSFSYVERSMNHSKSIFDNLSPIKSTKASPQKNHPTNNEIRVPSNETVAQREKSKSPAKRTRNERSPEIRIPEEPLKTFSTAYEQPPVSFEDRFNKSKSVNQSRAEFNNYQNPMEQRHLDPVYNSYWAYHRDHNKTLSPEYFHKVKSQNLLDNFRKNTFSATGRNHHHHYFNPAYVESAASDFQRFPYNPFRYTDHEHYFQSYYGNLRNNYYERHYHHTPYAEKVTTLASPSKTTKTSPIKIKNAPPNFAPSHRRLESRHIHLQSVVSEPQLAAYQHYQGPSYANTKRSTGNLHHYDLANPLDERLQSIQDQSAPLPPVYQDHKSEKLSLDDFLYQRPGQHLEAPRNPQPYSYVVKDA